jgi:predicted acylesterase/phospholipase RssA
MATSKNLIPGATAPERTASVAALTTATGAVACGVCCALPPAFPPVAAAGTGGVLASFAGARSWATAVASVIVAGAWISIGIQSHRARRRPSRPTVYAMTLATAVLVLAVLWPRIEPRVIRAVTQQ